MKYFFLSIDTLTLILTYVILGIVIFSDKVNGLDTVQFTMIAILFADRMQNEIKKDLKL